jgi:hypothetical protein
MVFTVSSDWSVLVLEDTEQRIAWFRQRLPNAIYAATATAAIRAIKTNSFRLVFLDHDLGFLDAADPYRPNSNGKEVARYLAEINFPGIVIIHSLNVVGREIMARILPQAHVAPYGSFEISRETPSADRA